MNRQYSRIKYTVVGSLAAILIGSAIYMNSLLPIATGYAAKNLASAVFVSNRLQEDVEALDLNFSLIKYTRNKVDYENKRVTSTLLWGKSVAVYREGYGCTLVKDFDDFETNLPKLVAPYSSDTLMWPMGNILPDTAIISETALAMLSEVKDNLISKGEYGGHAFAFVVLHKGIPVMEGYNKGIDQNTKLLSWSMAKSFTSALAGVMVKNNLLDIYAPSDLDEWEDDKRSEITVNNLLRMESGLRWNENYGNRSDVTIMLHCEEDFAEYAAEKSLKNKPGEAWYYSSGSTNIANKVMRNRFNNDSDYYRFAHEQLFYKTGMPGAVFELDESGTQVGSSYVYATARDYARFALLYLNDGYFEGEQIFPQDWVEYTTSMTSDSNGEYGSSFWLNLSKTLPSAPSSMYSCNGHDGQRIFILPEQETAIVVLGFSPKDSNNMDFDSLVRDVLVAISN